MLGSWGGVGGTWELESLVFRVKGLGPPGLGGSLRFPAIRGTLGQSPL